jgi:sulfur carrier protein
VRASINGKHYDLPDGLTVAQLLDRFEVAGDGVAIAKNDSVVRRSTFHSEPVRDGDRIEIIKAVAGG